MEKMVSTIKLAALKYMAEPTDIQQLRRFLGMVNQSYQHIPKLTHPLRGLRNKKNACVWAPPQKRALETFKEKLSSAPALEIFDITLETTLSADASSYGVGAVLSQKQTDGKWKAVVFISRALTPTERPSL